MLFYTLPIRSDVFMRLAATSRGHSRRHLAAFSSLLCVTSSFWQLLAVAVGCGMFSCRRLFFSSLRKAGKLVPYVMTPISSPILPSCHLAILLIKTSLRNCRPTCSGLAVLFRSVYYPTEFIYLHINHLVCNPNPSRCLQT